jgi:hypothetical protein
MKLFVLLLIATAFFGCALTPNVDTRKPGQPWNYYGDLGPLYRDQTGGTRVDLVWMEQVTFVRVEPKLFAQTVKNYMKLGYRKIGFVGARSEYFVDPYELKKLAADKGARLIIGCWFTARVPNGKSRMVDYWYQLLDKSVPAAPPAPIVPLAPTPTPRQPDFQSPGDSQPGYY